MSKEQTFFLLFHLKLGLFDFFFNLFLIHFPLRYDIMNLDRFLKKIFYLK